MRLFRRLFSYWETADRLQITGLFKTRVYMEMFRLARTCVFFDSVCFTLLISRFLELY